MRVGVQNNAMTITLTKQNQWLDSLKFLVKCIEESMRISDEA
ncbi:Transcription-repair coupling factor [Staphylococcus aureus]|nr:Transcription-repair coupling factor [Staphylococcus aureus]